MATPARSWLTGTAAALRPPPKLTLSEWADKNFRLSGSSADAGKWHTRPYQRGIMDAITDPAVERVSVMKSARIGWTQMMNAAIGYFMDHDPCPILGVQPTVETAEIYSREMIAPMLRDVPVLADLVGGSAVKTTARTLLHKTFPGGVLSLVGANSGTGFAMIDRRVVAFDEVDRYPPSAGDEGDPIALGEKRTQTYWNRKIIAGSTPLVAGSSRIEELFFAGDQRRYYVPCPHCGHMDYLRFNVTRGGEDDAIDEYGHLMRWEKDRPETACFWCGACGCAIEEMHKEAMIEAGEWRASAQFSGHASFHVWSAYSTSPNAGWGDIAARFIDAKRLGPEKLKTVINTDLGETWKERGEAPDWERLYDRREPYAIGSVPDGVIVVTGGVDVQQDRFMYEIVGWSADKESFSIEAGALWGDTANEATWAQLDTLLGRSFPGTAGQAHQIAMLAVDGGYRAQMAYAWARRHAMTRVIVCKGASGARALVSAPSPVDVTIRGRRMQRGYKVWSTGVDIAKAELYGWLRLRIGENGEVPPGYCHFPEYAEDYFQQLTAEHLVTTVNKRTRRTKLEWQVLPNRENHYLDARILSRVAAHVLGIDRLKRPAPSAIPAAAAAPSATPRESPPHELPNAPRSGFWASRNPRGQAGGGWLKKRR